MNFSERVYLLSVPADAWKYASLRVRNPPGTIINCRECGHGVRALGAPPPVFHWEEGLIADFPHVSGRLVARLQVGEEISEKFPEVECEDIMVISKHERRDEGYVELRTKHAIRVEDLPDSGIEHGTRCWVCGNVSLHVPFIEETFDPIRSVVKSSRRGGVTENSWNVVAIPSQLREQSDIFRVEYLKMCTDPFVQFCVAKQYSNIVFVPLGHVV